MVTLGIDAHKRSHTVVPVDDVGRELGQRTTNNTTTADHLALIDWAQRFGEPRIWAVEDCRYLSHRLEADLLAAGETIVRVPPKLMAQTRKFARSYGKSDPIDALAVARAALANPDLPMARLAGPEQDLRVLVDYRNDLVKQRTRAINQLRWHLHALDPALDPPAKTLNRLCHLDRLATRLADLGGYRARIARELVIQIRDLTRHETALEREITTLVIPLAPNLLAVVGVGPLTAAELIGQTADITRFRNADCFARHNGTAPVPVWSGNTKHFRLSRHGNRQLNAAIHRVAKSQQRWHPDAKAYLERRRANGNTTQDAFRALKRRLSDVIYRAMLADAQLRETDSTHTNLT